LKPKEPLLPATEWDFTAIPDEELIACCLWEYARESATFMAPKEYLHRREGTKDIWELAPDARVVLERVLELPSEQSSRLYSLLTMFNGLPWTALDALKREQSRLVISSEVTAIRHARLSEVEALLAANRDLPAATIEALVQRGVPRSRYAGSGRRRGPLASAEPLALSSLGELPDSDWTKGCLVMAVTVDFAHYSDRELAAVFERVLTCHRPAQFSRPRRNEFFAKGSGKKRRDWRTALLRLGIMRALHACSFADPRFPKPFKARGEKACYFARQAALKTFRTLFPSLPGDEMPIHWMTRGGRRQVRRKDWAFAEDQMKTI
jgi:hypothetical protein